VETLWDVRGPAVSRQRSQRW